MRVGPTGHNVQAAFNQCCGQHFGIAHDGRRIGLVFRAQSFTETNCFTCDDMHQRAALQAWENSRVEFLRQGLVIGQDDATARAAQRLVGR